MGKRGKPSFQGGPRVHRKNSTSSGFGLEGEKSPKLAAAAQKKNVSEISSTTLPQDVLLKLGICEEKGTPIAIECSGKSDNVGVADVFWAVESIHGKRCRRINGKKRTEYLVKWVGYDHEDNTWEPADNLSDTAMREALRWQREQNSCQKEAMKSEEGLGLIGDSKPLDSPFLISPPSSLSSSSPSPATVPSSADNQFDWSSSSRFLKFNPVIQIDVSGGWGRNNSIVDQITEYRRNGIPVVIQGFSGWAGFASNWVETSPSGTSLNVSNLLDDIGTELAPVIKSSYAGLDPIRTQIRVKTFLEKCYGISKQLYLHQWQFPLSLTAGAKLCHKNPTLPCFGDDLLQYWLDLPQCKGDSPLQYIFMGSTGTFSKLHQDNGGLAITISPIVGEKEVILAHRNDGDCLYHCQIDLNNPDFGKHPLLSQARLWRTTVKPGEILLLPSSTFHACRNVTNCLSYSRFHLDTVNMTRFTRSFLDEEDCEVEHDTVLWNAAAELIKKVDEMTDRATEERGKAKRFKGKNKAKSKNAIDLSVSAEEVVLVETLRELRHHLWEVAQRMAARVTCTGTGQYSSEEWNDIVEDIDLCLHEFRHRSVDDLPPFEKARLGGKGGGKPAADESVNESDLDDYDIQEIDDNDNHNKGGVDNGFNVNNFFRIGDSIVCDFRERKEQGIVLEVAKVMVATLCYEGFSSEDNEIHPIEALRVGKDANSLQPVDPGAISPGTIVYNRWGGKKVLYRAKVVECGEENVVKIRFDADHFGADARVQWIRADSILYAIE